MHFKLFVFIQLVCVLGYTQEAAFPKFKFRNDFRFRTENIKQEQVAPLTESDRSRQRIRLRLGGQTQINEQTSVAVRFVTGSTSNAGANTANTDLSDYYSKKNIVLDLAYFQYKANENLTLLGGKTLNYFYQNHGADLIFDTDITPEGLVLNAKTTPHEGRHFFLNAMTAWLDERFSATGVSDNTDVGLVGLQVGGVYKLETHQVNFNLVHLNFSNIKGATAPIAAGNSLVGGAYEFDYKLTAVEAELTLQVADKPLSIFYQASTNSEARRENRASLVGFRYGNLIYPGMWTWGADYREVQKDSVVGVLADSNSSGGGADIRSTRLITVYQFTQDTNVALTFFSGQSAVSSPTISPNYQRIIADVNFIF